MDDSFDKKYDTESDDISILKFLIILWKGKIWIIISTIIFLFIGMQYFLIQDKIYTAKTIFGYKQNSTNIIPQEVSFLTGLTSNSEDDNIITQIKGANFLRLIVKKLDLTNNSEFYSPPKKVEFLSVAQFKILLKKLLGIEQKILKHSNEDKVEIVVKILKNKHFEISRLKTGGFEITINSRDPNTASLIANTIVSEFIALRLKNKISKSEDSLSYLSEKLGEAKARLEKTKSIAEVFALEKNVLSDQEFAIQSKRLKEFRVTIAKLRSNLNQLKYFQEIGKDTDLLLSDYDNFIENVIDISPRIKPNQRFLDEKGKRDIKREFQFILKNLPKEIARIEESLKITLDGSQKLETKAKSTSSESRELQNLQMNVGFATARYEALVKEFERQSLIEGYEEAIGEIYETAIPPLSPSFPKSNIYILASLLFGIFFGILISILVYLTSNKLYFLDDLKKHLNTNQILTLSSRISKLRLITKMFLDENFNRKINKDILKLNLIASKLIDIISKNRKTLNLVCASTGNELSPTAIALILATFLNNKNTKSLIVNYSDSNKIISKIFNKKKLLDRNVNGVLDIKPNLKYINAFNEKPVHEKPNDFNLIINIVSNLGSEPKNLQQTLDSEFFILIIEAKKTRINELKTISESIHLKEEKFLGSVFVS